ncbi:hypothetical protein LUW10_14950 [Pseudomonas veronii]|uniref:hypothetical protein n=1 Tax=Pseudomonas veronii TaxID=76761 RepID=UPI001E4316F3|nr:hypothetical protein [Pseudomonas veronii]UHH33041.1 hypothetical protein LUW10_14950 [Pseudomonas veronii]
MAELSATQAQFPPGSMEEKWYQALPREGAFSAIHVPGLLIPFQMPIRVGDILLERFSWNQWVLFERTDEATRLKLEFDRELHTFLTCRVATIVPLRSGLEAVHLRQKKRIQNFTSALRLLKEGTIIDPYSSVHYIRQGDFTRREIGTFGRGLIEADLSNKYILDAKTLKLLPELLSALSESAITQDPTIGLAIRSFDRSYGYSLEHEEKMAFLFSALEATFGEYQKKNRPKPRVTIGKAASMASCSAATADIADFLDDAEKGRKLRNTIAHGSSEPLVGISADADLMLREIVRDGLRCLIIFATRKSALSTQLESLQKGLSLEPAKLAFQSLLGYASTGNAAALKIIADIQAPYQ